MFSKGIVIVAIGVGSLVAAALVTLFEVPLSVSVFAGLAVSGWAATIPWTLRDGRFPGPRSSARARRVTGAASALILGSALVGVAGLDVERSARLGLQLLVLAVGSAAFSLGAAAAVLDADEPSTESDRR